MTNVLGKTIPSVLGGNEVAEYRRPFKIRDCTTPEGQSGFCQSLSDCPDLVLKMSVLRKSVCLKRLFEPGICCPDVGQLNNIQEDVPSTASPISQQVRPAVPHTQHVRPLQNIAQTVYNPNFPLGQHQQGLIPGTHPFYQGQNPQLQGAPLVPQTVPLTPIANTLPANSKIRANNVIANDYRSNRAFQCGVPKVAESRVVGGDESHLGQWPWMAGIYLHGPENTEFWCGGALISENYVITAAHCTKDANENTFEASQFTVHLGDNHIESKRDDRVSPPKEYRVRFIIPHPEFKRSGYFNDVALFKLTRTVDFSQYILPVCLPPTSMERSPLDSMVGQTPTAIGYGSTYYDGPHSNALRDVKLPIWRNADCDKTYFQPITEIFLCAGYKEGGKDACQGDSGGPLQLYVNGRWTIIGIVSFGNRCAEPGYPGVYTRITKFLPWIRQNMR